MLVYSIRRIFQTIPVLIGVTLVVFLMMHLIPGDPAQIIAGERADPEQVEQLRDRLGLNDPLYIQYGSFVTDAAQGDLGNSLRNGRPISSEIFDNRIWVTLELAIYSTILSVFMGIIAGVISATRRGSFTDMGIMVFALFGLSMPNFWLGLMLIQYLALPPLQLFPVSGWGTPEQIVLPVITLGTAGAAIIARMTRSSMLEVINQDYIRTARAKGVKERYVVYKHALRNALIPVVTVVGLQFGTLLGGAVLTETVFSINGLGRYVVDSIGRRDFPAVQGSVLVLAMLFVFVNYLVDISYRVLNKRIELD
ncbi:ABC transporter permease [Salisediminibacterium selenitireducens]|uniref:Binding-protein-dependent transport systems inner membrane component n=1 Tax=Bacillus selenitireducens (strain ATCC 700615 / DSM 15326 / MLS10) TaxID=439292 RepID=D6Y1G5_BACIE|nr:ABC transporter permease [Salisediminibacterium selenitireducens]ADI00752.1 binding-protein-dependent transport systems inner membrane component [[Bacillus] selenitireducens MLS10]